MSPQRRAIAATAASIDRAFTVADLAEEVTGRSEGIGVATVYRAVSAMTDAGFLEVVGEREGHALYVRCREERHHHHLVCTGCGAVADVGCAIDGELRRSARRAGYSITGHELTAYGICGKCSQRVE